MVGVAEAGAEQDILEVSGVMEAAGEVGEWCEEFEI